MYFRVYRARCYDKGLFRRITKWAYDTSGLQSVGSCYEPFPCTVTYIPLLIFPSDLEADICPQKAFDQRVRRKGDQVSTQ
jgi:hypothetical protein